MDWIEIAALAVSILMAVAAGVAKIRYDQVKAKITAIRVFMDKLDNDLADNTLTKEEIIDLLQGLRDIVGTGIQTSELTKAGTDRRENGNT